ncbi:MFS transporter [Desulfolithobacter sp.]
MCLVAAAQRHGHATCLFLVSLAAGGLALASAPEAFLVLWASDQGLQVAWVPLLWAAASAVKAVVAGPAGCLSDRFGRLAVLLVGWSLRIVLLLALAWSCGLTNQIIIVWMLFLGYAAALASTEGAEHALVGDFARSRERATAFGLYHMVVGLAALPGPCSLALSGRSSGQRRRFCWTRS